MQNFVSTIGAMHEKKIEAMHIDNIFPEFRQGGLPSTCPSSRQSWPQQKFVIMGPTPGT